jgi:hypothetical protein
MANLHSGIMGPVSGKVGNLVYYISHGRNFVRNAPRKSKKKASLKQKIQRAKFGMVAHFLAPISKLVNESCQSVNGRTVGTNLLMKQIIKEGITGKYPHFEIYCPEVKLLRGKLPWTAGTLQYNETSTEFNIDWPVLVHGGHLEDELIVMIRYCGTDTWLVAEGVAQRAQGTCTLRIDETFGNQMMRVWIAFRSPDLREFSDSQYLGEVVYQTQPYDD